jgi:putative membrane protein
MLRARQREGSLMRLGGGTALGATLAVALLLAGCGSQGGAASGITVEDGMFLAAALAHTDSQLALAHMAEEKAKTPAIVAYAKRIEDERTGLDQRLAAAAKEHGVGPSTNSAPRIENFQPLEGVAFERAYVAAEIEDERNDLDFFVFESENGGDSALKKMAAAEIPQLKQDLATADGLAKEIPFEPAGGEGGEGISAR